MQFEPILRANARRVPAQIRKTILQENWIQKVTNVHQADTIMEFLFDVFVQYIDTSGDHADFSCHQCRQAIIENWKALEPFLKELEDAEN